MDADRDTVYDWLRARSFDDERCATARKFAYGSLRRWCHENGRGCPPQAATDAALEAAGFAFIGPNRDVLGLRLVGRFEGDLAADGPFTPEAASAVAAFLAEETFPARHEVPYSLVFHVLVKHQKRTGQHPVWLADDAVTALLRRNGYRVTEAYGERTVHGLDLVPRDHLLN